MGDRAMAEIKTEGGSIYFYTHWTGSTLADDAKAAMDKASPRKNDSFYSCRIVLDSLIESSGSRDQETGSGIMLSPDAEDEYNYGNPSVIIDLLNWSVESKGHVDWTKL